MIKWIVEPVIRNGAELEYPSDSIENELKIANTVLIVSNTPGKKYSMAVKINNTKINNTIQEPTIRIDKSIIGSLQKGDKVLLRPFNPPTAKQVLMILDSRLGSKLSLVEGNWGTKIINPAIMGQIIDIGQNVEFIYGLKSPAMLTGLIKATIPKAPALVDDQTVFFIEKKSDIVITDIKIESENNNEARAEEFIKLIEEENFESISSIRNESSGKIEKTFNFSQVEPETIYKMFKNWLESGSHTFYLEQFEVIKDNTIGTLLAFPKTKSGIKPDYLIEINLSATLKQGSCLILGYSANIEKVNSKVNDIIKQLRKLTPSLKEIPQAIPDICGGCAGKLNLTKQNEKGIVICDKCLTPNVLPFSLRT